jgi:formamidopyrimidine-DNA glycosylase
MDAKRVVGIGNIYANEALFLSGIRPSRRANRISRTEANRLCANVKKTLSASIAAGGTSFRDYVDADQKPGLHQLSLFVYGREDEPCRRCQTPVKRVIQGQRSSFYCPKCQA